MILQLGGNELCLYRKCLFATKRTPCKRLSPEEKNGVKISAFTAPSSEEFLRSDTCGRSQHIIHTLTGFFTSGHSLTSRFSRGMMPRGSVSYRTKHNSRQDRELTGHQLRLVKYNSNLTMCICAVDVIPVPSQ